MTGNLQHEERPLDEEIARELVSLTPESWKAAVLDVHWSSENGVERYTHVISSPEGHREPIVPSEHLFDVTHRLRELFKKHGRPWKRANYRVDVKEAGASSYTVTFEY